MAFYILHHVWYMQNNSVAAPFNMLAKSMSCGNIRCFDQNYQLDIITLQVSVLIIRYLVPVSFGQGNMCCTFGFCEVVCVRGKRTCHLKGAVDSELKKKLINRF